jgi:hypothetical protein
VNGAVRNGYGLTLLGDGSYSSSSLCNYVAKFLSALGRRSVGFIFIGQLYIDGVYIFIDFFHLVA